MVMKAVMIWKSRFCFRFNCVSKMDGDVWVGGEAYDWDGPGHHNESYGCKEHGDEDNLVAVQL